MYSGLQFVVSAKHLVSGSLNNKREEIEAEWIWRNYKSKKMKRLIDFLLFYTSYRCTHEH